MKGKFIDKRSNQKKSIPEKDVFGEEGMRLNKFLAHSGVASRRQAAEFIKAGQVKVNDKVIENPGHKVQREDVVKHKDQIVTRIEERYYMLLNKPKDMITSRNDENDRRTVMDLIPKVLEKIVYPVGRLDRMTTGLLLLTNDGDLALRMMHPRHLMSKVYEITLDKEVSQDHIDQIAKGITLEDGPVEVDAVNYIFKRPKNEVAIELHLGRNRIVRRIFEHFGYKVLKLDRTQIAGLTKKDIPRGRFRHLTEREIIMLKHF